MSSTLSFLKSKQRPVEVKTSKGPIKGITRNYNSTKFYSFNDIPYAHIPEGQLRFAPPKEIESWPDLISLKKYSSNNILVLNIHTPELKSDECNKKFDRPVIAYVAGYDGTVADVKNCEPHYLMCENVVLVTISYRVGLTGFLKFSDPDANAPGDVGLKDLQVALTWIKKEIEKFGGCSNNITAYGQGYGAMHIRFLLMSPIFQNSFDKAILSSCISTTLSGPYMENGNFIGGSIVKLLNEHAKTPYVGSYEDDLACVDFLRKIPEEKMSYICNYLASCTKVMLNRNDLNIIINQTYQAKLPIIIGYNSQEYSLPKFINKGGTFSLAVLNKILVANDLKELKEDVLEDLNATTWNLASDFMFLVSIMATTRNLMTAMSPQNVYLYRFDVNLEYNTRNMEEYFIHPGSRHEDELYYIFKNKNNKTLKKDSYEVELVKRMTKLWAQFARTGDPNPPDQDELLRDKWIPLGKKLSHCFEISNIDVEYREIPEAKRMKYLESNYYKVQFFSSEIKKKQMDKVKGG